MESAPLICMGVMRDARQRNVVEQAISIGKRHTGCPTDTYQSSRACQTLATNGLFWATIKSLMHWFFYHPQVAMQTLFSSVRTGEALDLGLHRCLATWLVP